MADEKPKKLRDDLVGRAVVHCPGCKEQRWYGYGACGRCGQFLEEEPEATR